MMTPWAWAMASRERRDSWNRSEPVIVADVDTGIGQDDRHPAGECHPARSWSSGAKADGCRE